MLPVLTRQKILMISGAGSPAMNDVTKYPYYISATPNGDAKNTISSLPDRLKKDGVGSLAALVPSDALGQGTTGAVKKLLEGSGVELTVDTYNPTDIDLTVPYSRVLDKGADAIFLEGSGEPVGRLLAARLKLDPSGKVPVYLGPGPAFPPPSTVAPRAALTNMYLSVAARTVFVPDEQRSKTVQGLIDEMKLSDPANGSLLVPGIAFDGIRLLQAAATAAKSSDPDAMKSALENLPKQSEDFYVLHDPDFTFSKDTHYPVSDENDFKWINPLGLKDGFWTSE
jgi:ABC-type branched-subunit amino acid transport system substrate-binding protein